MTDREPLTRAVRYARWAGFVSVGLGTLGLIGWATGNRTLISVRDAWPPVRPTAAIAFVALGLALRLVAELATKYEGQPARGRRLMAQWLGAFVGLLGAVTIVEYLSGWNPGLDSLLFPNSLSLDTGSHPGRMSPDTSLAVLLLGATIILAARERVAGWMTATASALSVGALTIALAGVSVLLTPALGYESWLGARGMSPHSTVAIAAVAAAYFLVELQRRPGLWALGTRTAHTFGVSIVLMLVTALTSSRLQHRMAALANQAEALQDARTALQYLVEGTSRAQTALYLRIADADTSERTVFVASRALADTGLTRLRDVLALDPDNHAAHFVLLERATRQLAVWQDSVLAVPTRSFTAATRAGIMARGFTLVQAQEQVIHGIAREHDDRIALLEAERARVERRAYEAILFSGLGSVAVLILAMLSLNKTERSRRAASELAASEFRWKFAIEGAGDGLWDADVESGRVYYSPQWKRLLGYTDAEIGETLEEWSSRLHPDDRLMTMAAMQAALAGRTPQYESEHRLRCADGSWKWVFSRGVVVERNSDGTPRRAIGTMTDVTARHRMESALAESEARYRNLVERLPQAIFIHRGGVVLFVNPAAVKMMRATSASVLVGTQLIDLVHPESRPTVLARVRHAEATGGVAPLAEERLLRCDGTDFLAEVIGAVVFFDGAPALLASAWDVTARKEAEAALRDSESRFHTVFREAPLGIAVVDSETGGIIELNRRVEEITGWSRDQLVGGQWMHITHPDDVARNLELIAAMRDGRIDHYQLEKRYLRPDGSTVWVRLTGARMSAGAEGVRHVSMIEDITASKNEASVREQLERQLNAAQRMEAVGRLAGGVAHDFNNMLGVILGTTEMAMRRLKATDPLAGDLREIQSAARHSSDLTRQLLAFARRQVVAPTVLDANAAVTNSLGMLRRLIGEDVTLHWEPMPALWPIVMDATQLDQILTNLVLNARQAINGVGTITIATENRVVDEAFCARHPDSTPGHYACLSVRDTGSGMSPDVLAKIFEPFFTTKALGEGTGLGLATVYGAVRQNQGFIAVTSAPGKGTTFDIYFPRHGADERVTVVEERRDESVRGAEKILIVEDEPAILRMTVRMLESQGYEVLGLTNPREAVALDATRVRAFDLLLTDVVMPGINGRELAATLTARAPKMQVLFMSGHPSDVMQEHGIVADGVNFIQKPFTTTVIAAKVRETLGKPLAAGQATPDA